MPSSSVAVDTELDTVLLKPIDSSTREIKSLDGLWRFAPASDNLAEPWKSVLPGDLECPVPASYNDIFLLPSLRNHVGKVWYQRTVHIPRGWKDQRIFLRLDAATHEGEVYVGDKKIASHVGGYTPFEADLTEHVKPGEAVRVTVGVDNILTHETVPPGEVVTNAVGKKEQKYFHDFFNYAGLARSVRLCCAPKNRVEDITVTTDVRGSAGAVEYKLELEGKGRAEAELLDAEDKVVGKASGLEGLIDVANAKLWQPGAAYLYSLRIRLYASDTSDELVDEYSIPVGIRTVKVSGKKFLINDKPFYFRGFGKHEDTPVKGKGHDDAWMVHDFELMRWIGANSFRTSHYPYAEDVMDYADKHGWVVIGETAAVGLNLGIISGITGGPKRKTFAPDFANDNTQAALRKGIEELLQRDKNHPSVVMWSITNEPDSSEEGSRPFFEPLVKRARELDPTRPLTYANVTFCTLEKDILADLFDVIGLNRYYGWYEFTGNLEIAEQKLEAELLAWEAKHQKPMIMFEYGVDTVTGLHSVHAQPWSEEYQVEYYEMYHRVFDRVDAVIGEQAWNFADFGTGVGIFRVDGNRKGVFTRDRRPKAAAHTFRKRWTGK
ncbi:glycoside hydrolase superfamily [Dioszegia hungarica]|uniref:Beta-glucuronidase n=1 Tax=Dioszegia hungarica TaxID=4972 RepID=A0AA38H6F2_9TREE|nr:glycoside hydrolase superfamily [Dioszegia hungarica]KAI9633776.1 glycoside hydrolase superfamily [Dioszegia hungarica]